MQNIIEALENRLLMSHSSFYVQTNLVSDNGVPGPPTHPIREVDNSAAGAVYKGAAIGRIKKSNFLYAADFHNNRIDVFDSAFHPVSFKHSPFTDTHLRAGYAPFNVANIGGNLFVSY